MCVLCCMYMYIIIYTCIGEEAVKAKNTFFYLTYNGCIDLDSVTDPHMRKVYIVWNISNQDTIRPD